MSAGLSQRIVSFIASLYPLYEYTTVEGRACARSLVDGTLIFPLDEDDDENDFVEVHWQGDPNRTCQTLGHSMASIAVARYIELNAVATNKPTKAEYARLSEHFTFITDSSLAMEGSDGADEAYALLGQLLEKAGTGVAIAILKKALGL